MTAEQLTDQIKLKKSFLCVGLDTDIDRIPSHLNRLDDPVYEFNRRIIDATIDHCIAYKPNLAFYEAMGSAGLESLQKTLDYLPDSVFTIADAKRGDIGNTCRLYAKAFFNRFSFDAVTLSPYMGHDSITPYLEHQGKWAIILALTSNAGSMDFQLSGYPHQALYLDVIRKSSLWGTKEQIMYVVGATQSEYLKEIRQVVPDHFLLIPGVGAQGGDLETVVKYGLNRNAGLIVNSSRSIIYASEEKDFDQRAGEKATALQQQMQQLMDKYL